MINIGSFKLVTSNIKYNKNLHKLLFCGLVYSDNEFMLGMAFMTIGYFYAVL